MLPSATDVHWGWNCEACETRLNAGQAEQARRRCAELGLDEFICGACRDEWIAEKKIQARDDAIATYKAIIDELEEKVRSQRHHIEALSFEVDESNAFLATAWERVRELEEKGSVTINNFYCDGVARPTCQTAERDGWTAL